MEYMQCTLHSTFAKPNTTQHNTTLNSTICLQVALVKWGKVLEILKSFANFESTNLTILSLSLLIPECIIFKIKATVVSRYIDIETTLILLAGKAGNLINILWWYLKMYRFHPKNTI